MSVPVFMLCYTRDVLLSTHDHHHTEVSMCSPVVRFGCGYWSSLPSSFPPHILSLLTLPPPHTLSSSHTSLSPPYTHSSPHTSTSTPHLPSHSHLLPTPPPLTLPPPSHTLSSPHTPTSFPHLPSHSHLLPTPFSPLTLPPPPHTLSCLHWCILLVCTGLDCGH